MSAYCPPTPDDPAGDLEQRAAAALRRVGPRVRSFLRGRLGCADAADEVYSDFCEDFWRGLPGFAGRASLSTWMFVLARNAASRHQRRAYNQPWRRIPIDTLAECLPAPQPDAQALLAERQLAVLLDELSAAERDLLLARVESGRSWRELARAALGETDPSPVALEREAARLRKRFQLIKDRSRELAHARWGD